jgi:hypothetical protein
MVMTKANALDKALDSREQTDGYPPLDVNYYQDLIITLNSNEVAWLFGTDVATVEHWVDSGLITPCSYTPHGGKRFWREDIAELLASCGA